MGADHKGRRAEGRMIRGGDCGRIRASEARCPMPGICSNCSYPAPDQAAPRRILLTNPAKLYGFPN